MCSYHLRWRREFEGQLDMTGENAVTAPGSGETASGNPRFGIERYGIDTIPDPECVMTLKDLARFWIGTNLYLFNFVIGGLVYTLGLTLWQSLLCVVLGNLFYALVALGSIAGLRSRVPTLIVTRGAFGIKLNRLNSYVAWAESIMFEVINLVFGVFAVLALFKLIGWTDPGFPGTLLALLVVYSFTVTIAIMGHATVIWLQRVVAYLRIIIPVVFIFIVIDFDFGAGRDSELGAAETISLMITGIGIIAAAALVYMIIPTDYPRYLRHSTSPHGVFWTVLLSAGGTALAMGVFGVLVATQADLSNPVAGVQPLIPMWVYVIFVISVVGGALGNNVITVYSAGLIVQSTGIPLKRWQASILHAIIAIAVTGYVLFFNEDFNEILNNALIFLMVWLAPFSAIWIVDAILRRFRYDPHDLHRRTGGRYWATNGIHVSALVALICGALSTYLVISTPFLQGPLSEHLLLGADGSWLFGPVVAAGVYYALASRKSRRRTKDERNAHLLAEALQ